jgi:hypothetical protein
MPLGKWKLACRPGLKARVRDWPGQRGGQSESIHLIAVKSLVTATLQVQDHEAISRFFFSAEISEISPKTGFIGLHRYFLIPNEIFRYS